MSRYHHCLLLVLAACLTLLPGCGEDSQPAHPKLAVGSKVRDCDITFDGPGPANWRKHSLWIGLFGLAGPGPGPDFDVGRFEDGLLTVKTPTWLPGIAR